MDIKEDTCNKYLGIYVDNRLVWKNHIDFVYTKILKFVSIFYKLQVKFSSRILQMIYFSFIYPHLFYGIEVYANTNKAALKRLMVLNQCFQPFCCRGTLHKHEGHSRNPMH